MKIRIDIDTTPAEVREFFGLPNLKQLQEGLVDSISEHMKKGTAGFDPFTVMKSVWPTQLQTIEALQNALWIASRPVHRLPRKRAVADVSGEMRWGVSSHSLLGSGW